MTGHNTSQVIALGGGGFSMEPDNPALDRYILQQARRRRPTACFLPTATDNADSYLLKFYQAFSRLDCRPTHLSLFSLPAADLHGYVLEQEVIYVGGGNTRSLLALWREWGLDRIFRAALAAGVVLAGLSAGANCWFEQCTTDSVPGELRVLPCLGLLLGALPRTMTASPNAAQPSTGFSWPARSCPATPPTTARPFTLWMARFCAPCAPGPRPRPIG